MLTYIHTNEKTKKLTFQKKNTYFGMWVSLSENKLVSDAYWIVVEGGNLKANIFLLILFSLFPGSLTSNGEKIQIPEIRHVSFSL